MAHVRTDGLHTAKAPSSRCVGVGGGGGNAVTHMVNAGIEGVDFICINTDAQALKHSKVKTRAADRLRTSPRAWAPAPTRKSAARPRWKIATASSS